MARVKSDTQIEMRLALVQTAAQLPAVRAKTDPKEAADAAVAISAVWYNYVVEAGEPTDINDIL